MRRECSTLTEEGKKGVWRRFGGSMVKGLRDETSFLVTLVRFCDVYPENPYIFFLLLFYCMLLLMLP